MNTPSISNPKWQELILSFETPEFKSLAFQMIIIRTKERFNNNEIDMDSAIYLLYSFCEENISGSNLQHDLSTIFGENEFLINFDTENKKEVISEDINRETNNLEIENQKDVNLEKSNYSNDEVVTNQNELKPVTNSDDEREKLIHQLETLKNKVDEVKKTSIQKKKKNGFFKNLFN